MSKCEYCQINNLDCDFKFPCKHCKSKRICKYYKYRSHHKGLRATLMAEESESIGVSVGGAKDITNFYQNIKENFMPKVDSITYEGIFYDHYFDTGNDEPQKALFYPTYMSSIDKNPLTNKPEVFLSVGLNSGIQQKDFKRRDLNLVIVLDISGSMQELVDTYHYDQILNMQTSQRDVSIFIPRYGTNIDPQVINFIDNVLKGNVSTWSQNKRWEVQTIDFEASNRKTHARKLENYAKDQKKLARKTGDIFHTRVANACLGSAKLWRRQVDELPKRKEEINMISSVWQKISKLPPKSQKRRDITLFMNDFVNVRRVILSFNYLKWYNRAEYNKRYGNRRDIERILKQKERIYDRMKSLVSYYYKGKNVHKEMKKLYLENTQRRQATARSKSEDEYLLALLDVGQKETAKSKMQVANETLTHLIDKLNIDDHDDRLGIVLFNDNATAIQTLLSDKEKLKQRILGIKADGGTNLEAGYLKAMELFETIREPSPPQTEFVYDLDHVKMIVKQLQNALVDELIAAKQYQLDAEAFEGEIRKEFLHHVDDEKKHAEIISEMLIKVHKMDVDFEYPTKKSAETKRGILLSELKDELKAVYDYEEILKVLPKGFLYNLIDAILEDEREHASDLYNFLGMNTTLMSLDEPKITDNLLRDAYKKLFILQEQIKKSITKLDDVKTINALTIFTRIAHQKYLSAMMRNEPQIKEIVLSIINKTEGDIVRYATRQIKDLIKIYTEIVKKKILVKVFLLMIFDLKNVLKEIIKDKGYENRIIVITDAMPNIGKTDTKQFNQLMEIATHKNIFTTFVGVGVDFNPQFVEHSMRSDTLKVKKEILKVRGANYYSVVSADDFRRRLVDEFEYMVTPIVFDLTLKLKSNGFQIYEVYGNPDSNKSTGELMNVNTLFPSAKRDGKTRGGMVLLKLIRIGDDPLIELNVKYYDRDDNEGTSKKVFSMQNKSGLGIEKAIALVRFVSLIKEWISNDESIHKRIEMKWESTSNPLIVSEPYNRKFAKFLAYFEKFKLERETNLLKKLVEYKRTYQNTFDLTVGKFEEFEDLYIIFKSFKIEPDLVTVLLSVINKSNSDEVEMMFTQGKDKTYVSAEYEGYSINVRFEFLSDSDVMIKVTIK